MARMPTTSNLLRPLSPVWQCAVGALLGSCLLHLSQSLPTWPWPGLIGLALARPRSFRYLGISLALLYGWSWWSATDALDDRWPSERDDQVMVVVGEVVALPTVHAYGQRFHFAVDQPLDVPEKLLISVDQRIGTVLKPGQVWTMAVELRAPRGFGNPTSFDRPRWMLVNGFGASCRVVSATQDTQDRFSVDRLRDQVGSAVTAALDENRSKALLKTLMIADKRSLAPEQREHLRHAGLAHIAAISGLHISIAAAVGGALGYLIALITAWSIAVLSSRPRSGPDPTKVAIVFGLALAFIYAVLAGLPLSAQRALIAFAAISVYGLLGRSVPLGHGIATALVAILVFDPLAPLDTGFWLSFTAVAILYLGLRGRDKIGWKAAFRAQGLLLIALPPLTWLFFGEAPVLASMINIVAVPWASLVLVPCALAAIAFAFLGGANPFLWLAYAAAEVLWWLADLATGGFGPVSRQVSLYGLVLPCVVILIWLLWPTARLSRLAIIVGIAWLLPRNVPLDESEFSVTVLDAGQGMAVVVETADGTLLYDTAPRYRSGFDLASVELLPLLRARGLRPDRIVISHWDVDHAGGLSTVRDSYPNAVVHAPDDRAHVRCEAGQSWRMGQVQFRVLHPSRYLPYQGNDSSCVLHVSSRFGSVLIPGDITAIVEQGLVKRESLASDVLIMSHHGSKHSSDPAFLSAVGADVAIASAGYRNRFAMPTEEVIERATAAGIEVLPTQVFGAVSAHFTAHGRFIECERTATNRYWDFVYPGDFSTGLTNHSCTDGVKTSIIPDWLAIP